MIAATQYAVTFRTLRSLKRKASSEPSWSAVRRAAKRQERRCMRSVRDAARAGKKAVDFRVFTPIFTNRNAGTEAIDMAARRTVDLMRPILVRDLEKALTDVIRSAGNAELKWRQRPRVGFRASGFRFAATPAKISFQIQNPEVQKWIQDHVAENVKNISDTSRDAIKEIIADSFRKNIPTNRIVSHIKGVIGLTPQQAMAVTNLRDSIYANPGGRVYAGGRAIRVPDDPTDDWVDTRLGKYADSLLTDRARVIARTETMSAANEGQRQAWLQAEEAGLIREGEVERVWIVTDDDRLCPICEDLDGETADLHGEFPGGYTGPPAHPQCRCAQGLQATEGAFKVAAYDPNQERDEFGRWSPSGSSPEQKKERLEKTHTKLESRMSDLSAKLGVDLGKIEGTATHQLSIEQHRDARVVSALEQGISEGKITLGEAQQFYRDFSAHEISKINADDDHYDKTRVEFANSWKSSSTSYGATQLKEAVNKRFSPDAVIHNPAGHPKNELSVRRADALVDRMYRETQEDARTMFPSGQLNPDHPEWDGKKITLKRGMVGNVAIRGVLESWTPDRHIAKRFAKGTKEKRGRVRTKTFTRNQILTFHKSRTWRGQGALQYQEKEFIIIRGIK